ncbi:ABC transporter permease subunit [Planotetraspora phitsanulokensis]|uniref:ABC transporter n=1 Tax=Planotetraspora phitsanulokensis TaxID=575192 RepID=A0A8J3TZY5_9ACTN|nr:ABC transporter permease subunit [Planotetraspora phitsanulokensis]GII35800.1 ABC transporter [Planotetraspora phitsanulokensis]
MIVTSLRPAFVSELTKIRTVRSTAWTLLLTLLVCAGLAYLVGASFRGATRRENFDPLFATFYSLTLGQLPLVVFGVLVVGAEYSSGTIRASLTAVPRRGLYFAGKVLACALPAFCVSLLTVPATFFSAQAGLGPYGTSLDSDVAAAAVGACLNLTLICVFAMGVAAMLRNTTLTLAILLPVFFLGSQGLGNIPGLRTVTQYLPDQVGMVVMHLAGPQGDPRWARDYGPWTGLGLLALWASIALVGGFLVLRRRDA